jgi:hypothetical protein
MAPPLPTALSLLLVFCFAFPLPLFAGLGSDKSLYVGGTVSAIPQNTEEKINAADSKVAVFHWDKGEWEIPYDKVGSLSYRQHAGRRVGAALGVTTLGIGALPMLFSKKRRHYFTIEYKDDAGADQAAIFEVQHKLFRLSSRHLQTSSASFADPKSPSILKRQPKPSPSILKRQPKLYAVPGEDPRLLAALSGHPDAQYDLGLAYARGQGVRSDYTVASTWLILAMANGEGRAESLIRELTPKLSESETGRIRWNLGEMYANGFGVHADKVTAYMWHCLAEAAGEGRSRSAKSELAFTMTSREVSDANARASLWLRRHRLSESTLLPVSDPSPRHQM